MKYRATRDGFSGQNFHTKCDGVSNTLTMIKTTNGNIFGSFAEKAWTSGTSVLDPKAFIISLINKENKPLKECIVQLTLKAYMREIIIHSIVFYQVGRLLDMIVIMVMLT